MSSNPDSILSTTAPTDASALRDLLLGALGALIALGCFLPPLVHFVSGPFGPLIAGVIVSSRFRLDERGRALVALAMGAVLAGVASAIAAAIRAASEGPPPSWFPAQDVLFVIVGGVFAWGAGLGAAGIALSAVFRKGTEATPPSAAPKQAPPS